MNWQQAKGTFDINFCWQGPTTQLNGMVDSRIHSDVGMATQILKDVIIDAKIYWVR